MGRAHCRVLCFALSLNNWNERGGEGNGERKNPIIMELGLELELEFILLFLVGGGPVFHIDFLSICD